MTGTIEDAARRICEIGKQIAELSGESKKLRQELGEKLKPKSGDPKKFFYFTGTSDFAGMTDAVVTAVTVAAPEDAKLKDFSVTFENLERARQ